MVGPAGPPATISREPGQARKGAAAAVTLCAGVWLVGFTSMTIYIPSFDCQASAPCESERVLTPIHRDEATSSDSSARKYSSSPTASKSSALGIADHASGWKCGWIGILLLTSCRSIGLKRQIRGVSFVS